MFEDKDTNANLYDDFEKNFLLIDDKLKDCPDITRRKVILSSGQSGCFFFAQGLCDIDLMQRDFLAPLLSLRKLDYDELKYLPNKIPVAGLTFPLVIENVIQDILVGNVVFICQGLNCGISCVLKKYEKRSIDEPQGEKNIRGHHDGFIEDMATNISTLRRKIKSRDLKFKNFTIGTTSNQTVTIAYIEHIANPNLLQILCDKLSKLNYDGFIGIGYIEQIITDNPNSIFPQYLATERPDKTMAGLLEGRFAIMLDETPFVLIVPVTINSFIQSPDDYNTNWMLGTYLNILRLIAVFVTLLLPGIYISILSFHYYMLPLPLLVVVAESRSKVPFPPVVEGFLIEFVIELIREASIRLPSFITSSVSIVGGLVIGQAAVQAGIVSNLMIILIATSAIAGFAIPTYDMGISFRMIKYIIMLLSSIFGIIGVIIPVISLIIHLIALDSLGQPYFQPIAPFKFRDFKDAILRAPLKFLRRRPDVAKPLDKKRGTGNG